MAVQGTVVAGVPVNLAFPNYMITYNFAGAPSEMNWVSADGSEAGIAPFVRMPYSPIWNAAPESLFDRIETYCGPGSFTPYKFVLDVRGTIFVNTNTFPAYATAEKQFVRIVFYAGVLGTAVFDAARQQISAAGFAKYTFTGAYSFTRYRYGIDVPNPGFYVYSFDDLSEPPNPPPAGFTHGGSIDIMMGGGIGAAWDGPF
jgi:hypothetical protein